VIPLSGSPDDRGWGPGLILATVFLGAILGGVGLAAFFSAPLRELIPGGAEIRGMALGLGAGVLAWLALWGASTLVDRFLNRRHDPS
jgi:hypothetical protein